MGAGHAGWKIWLENNCSSCRNEQTGHTFVNREPTALLLDIKDKGTEYLERTLPAHVKVFYHFEDMPQSEFKLIIAVTPYIYSAEIPMLCFHPAVLHLGIGCRKQCDPSGIAEYIEAVMHRHGLCPFSLASLNTIELKRRASAGNPPPAMGRYGNPYLSCGRTERYHSSPSV